jgi:hypothetical protein
MPDSTLQRQPQFESTFTTFGLSFELVDLPLVDIERVAGAQVRSPEIIAPPERIKEYALLMKAGADFPPIVVAEILGDRTNALIDGNTRAAAAQTNGYATIPAYIVSPVPDQGFAKMLGAALNQLGGDRLENKDAHEAGLYFIDAGWPDQDIARHLGRSAESVRKWRLDEEFAERVGRLNLQDEAEKLTATQRRGSMKVAHDRPFAELVKLTSKAKPKQDQFRELVAEIEQAASDDDAVAVIERAREDWQPITPAGPRRNPAALSAARFMGGLLKVEPAQVYDPTTADKDYEKWQQLRALCTEVLSVFEQHRTSQAA